MSNALGVAGFTNLDVVRNPSLSEAHPIWRARCCITRCRSADESAEATRNPLSLASTLPVRRLEFRLGKMSTVDFFDVNSVGQRQPFAVHELDRSVNNGAL